MKYLAFDCSSSDILVCVFNGEKKFNVIKTKTSGTEHLMEAIDECLKLAKMQILDIDCLGVCVGPGSWTGSRVGVVTALGILEGIKREIKLVAFNAFDLFSYNEIESDAVAVIGAYANFVYTKKDNNYNCVEKNSVKDKKIIGFEDLVGGTTIVERSIEKVMDKKIAEADFSSIDDLEPMYLRLSQAEIQLANKRGTNEN